MLIQKGKEMPVPSPPYRFVGTMPKGTFLDQPSQVTDISAGYIFIGGKKSSSERELSKCDTLRVYCLETGQKFSFLLRCGNETESLASFCRLGQH